MYGSGADQACGEGMALDLSIPIESSMEPPIRVHSALLKQYPPHLTTPPAHTPPTLRSLHTQAAFLFCLSVSITSPHSTPTSTYINPHLLPCLPIPPHLYPILKTLSITFSIPAFSVSSSLTSTYSPRAWEHNPLNERIWLSKINHKPKDKQMNHICRPPTLYNTSLHSFPLHPPTQL